MLHSYFIKVENFGQENFGESLVIRLIRQNILPTKFCLVRYVLVCQNVKVHQQNYNMYVYVAKWVIHLENKCKTNKNNTVQLTNHD